MSKNKSKWSNWKLWQKILFGIMAATTAGAGYVLNRKTVFSNELDSNISNDMLYDNIAIPEVEIDKLFSEEAFIEIDSNTDQTVIKQNQMEDNEVSSFKELENLVNQHGINTDKDIVKKNALSRVKGHGVYNTMEPYFKNKIMAPIFDEILELPEMRIALAIYINEYPDEAVFLFSPIHAGPVSNAAFHRGAKRIYLSFENQSCTSQFAASPTVIRHEIMHTLFDILNLDNKAKELQGLPELTQECLEYLKKQTILKDEKCQPEKRAIVRGESAEWIQSVRNHFNIEECNKHNQELLKKDGVTKDSAGTKLLKTECIGRVIKKLNSNLDSKEFVVYLAGKILCYDKDRIILEFSDSEDVYQFESLKMDGYRKILPEPDQINEAMSIATSNLPRCNEDRTLMNQKPNPCLQLETKLSSVMKSSFMKKFSPLVETSKKDHSLG